MYIHAFSHATVESSKLELSTMVQLKQTFNHMRLKKFQKTCRVTSRTTSWKFQGETVALWLKVPDSELSTGVRLIVIITNVLTCIYSHHDQKFWMWNFRPQYNWTSLLSVHVHHAFSHTMVKGSKCGTFNCCATEWTFYHCSAKCECTRLLELPCVVSHKWGSAG